MTTIYPYQIATSNLKLANLAKNIFKLSGQERKNALLQLKRYSEKHNINYNQLFNLFQKNVIFYQTQFALNNPDLSKKQVAKKQTSAFDSSVKRAVTQQYVTNIQSQNLNAKFIWLPSSADEPRDTHQQLYGNVYSIADPPLGVLPGQDYNCQCGMKILTSTI